MLGLANMLAKSRILNFNLRLRSQNEMYSLFSMSLCTTTTATTMVDPPTRPESPQLPSWINSVPKDPNDDFILPSVSYWVENYDKREDLNPVVSSNKVESDVDKISKIVKNPFKSPQSLVQALSGCDVCISESLISHLLKRFSGNWISVCGLFDWGKSKMGGSKFSPNVYNFMVECLGKVKKFDLMWDIVEEMDQQGKGYITLSTMALVMRRLAKAGKYDEAIDAFRGLEKFGIKKDILALNTIMDALVKEGSVERAQDIYFELRSNISPDLHTFNILIHGWSKARDFEKARHIMDEMKSYGFFPDVVSYTSFIEYYCHEKDFRKVYEVLEEMKKTGCLPNVVTYTIIMHAHGKAKEIDKALMIYETMKANGCAPDGAFCSSLIFILNKSGRLKDACQVFDDMPKQGISQDRTMYNTMIACSCQHLNEEESLKLLQRMEKNHVGPSCETYVPLLKMCCRLKRMKLIYFLLSHMSKNDVSVDINIYSVLVSGLCKSGKLEHACLFFEEAFFKGFVLQDRYKMLVRSLEANSMIIAKQRIEDLMQQNKISDSSEKLDKIRELA